MDSIIDLFNNITIDDNINKNVNDLITKISTTNIIDPEQEWMNVQKNYTNLIKLKEIVLSKDLLYKPFCLFMKKIVEINKYYIKNICLRPDDYTNNKGFNNIDLATLKDLLKMIFMNLEMSLQTNDYYKMLDYTLDAYTHIITIGEDLRSEKYIQSVDVDFLDTFRNKKRKIN